MSEESLFGVRIGDQVSFTRRVTEADVVAFAQVTGDTNPLHLDEAYAAHTRFDGRIAHGMLSAGFISAALGTKLAPQAVAIYVSQQLRFLRPVRIGDTVTAQCQVLSLQPERRLVRVKTGCVNQNGEELVTGEALLLLDEYRA